MISFDFRDACNVHDENHGVYLKFLYDVLKERLEEPNTNISHLTLPTYEEHINFVRKYPYRFYDVLVNPYDKAQCFGCAYVTKSNEIGIHIKKEHRNKGYGTAAVRTILNSYPYENFLANINPKNKASIKLFNSFGFDYIQNTYIKRRV